MENSRILIVDDNPEIREVVTILLEGEGFLTEEAGDGSMALDKIRQTSYDLILLDVMMPGLDVYKRQAESRIASVKMRGSLVHDEELAASGVGVHSSCHGQNAGGVGQVIGESVLGEFTLDIVAGAAHAVAVWASALDHKTVDDTVKNQAVVEALFDKADKVVDCIGGDFRV